MAGAQGGGTAATTPPAVLSTKPSNLTSGVPVNSLITASFSESITATSPATAFTLLLSGTPVTGTVLQACKLPY